MSKVNQSNQLLSSKLNENLEFSIDVNITDGILHAEEVINKDNKFAFYIRKDGQTIEKIMYSNQSKIEFEIQDNSVYSVRCFLKNNGNMESKQSGSFLNGEKSTKI